MISKFFIERPVLANVLAILMVVIGAVALAQLPQAVQAQGVTVQQKSTAILQFVTLISPDERYDSLFLANYATISLQPELARLPGVGQVNIFGAGQYSMRIWLDPNKLYARSLTTEDVVNALKGQNQQVTAGQLGMPPGPNTQAFQYTLDIAGRFDDVSQFENVVVKTEANGQMVHVRDVGRVELGAQTYSQVFTLNGKPAAGIGIFQTLEANALDVAGGGGQEKEQPPPKIPPRPCSHNSLHHPPALTPANNRLVRPFRGHPPGVEVGFPPRRIHPGPHRQDVRAVRAGDRRHGAAQRHQRRHAQADPVRAVAAAGRPAEPAQFFLPRVQ